MTAKISFKSSRGTLFDPYFAWRAVRICVTAGFILALTRHRPEKRASERSLFRGGIVAPAE